MRDFFPLYDIEMTFQTYLYFPCHYIANAMVIFAIGDVVKQGRLFFQVLFVFQIIEFVDYFFTYNTPWVTFMGIEIGVTLCRIVLLFHVTLYLVWKTS